MTIKEQIREIFAAGIAVVVVGTGFATAPDPAPPGDRLRIGAFNIQVFGETKLGKPDVVEVLVDAVREFDVVLVQEIRDADMSVADDFLAEVNDLGGPLYEMIEGPRLGRSNSKEQYVIYYIPERVQPIRHYHIPDDTHALFERPPIVATFRSGNFDFTLVGCHVKPDHAEDELRAMEAAVDEIRQRHPGEEDIILLGDFNADGDYLNESTELPAIFPASRYEIVITDDMVTTTRTENTYDRIVLRPETAGSEYVQGSAFPFEFDFEYGIADFDFVISVSDHYPVFAEFRTDMTDDD